MEEDLQHALMFFSDAKCFWEEAHAWFDIRLPRLHSRSWAKDILCDPMIAEMDRAKIIAIMWIIWHSRNRLKHDQKGLDPTTSLRSIKESLVLLELPRNATKILPGYGWRPPDEGTVKITTDGAINFAQNCSGAGGVARSSTAFLGAWCKPHVGISDPLIVEALAMRDGARFAKIRGFTHVIMEMDCLEMVEMVQLWSNRHNSRSIVAPILLEIGELVSDFSLFDVLHVNRSANVPAHLCAKHACTLNVTECWLEESPSFLVTSLLADCPRNALI